MVSHIEKSLLDIMPPMTSKVLVTSLCSLVYIVVGSLKFSIYQDLPINFLTTTLGLNLIQIKTKRYVLSNMSKNAKIVASATKIGKIFRLDTIANNQALMTKDNDLVVLFHRRFGHLSTSYLLTLVGKVW